MDLSETKGSRNCPTTTPAVFPPIDSIRAGIYGGRAHPFFGYTFPAGFSPAFHEFPTIDLALLFHDHATGEVKSRSIAAIALLLNDYRSFWNASERFFCHFVDRHPKLTHIGVQE